MEPTDEDVIDAEVTDIKPTEKAELVERETTDIVPVDEMTALIDTKITETVKEIFENIISDRRRAEDVFNEMNELFLLGETDPDFVRELNKAQENIQNSTESLVKTLDKLAKIKVGADKIQIANIQQESKQGTGNIDRATLVEILSEQLPDEE